jgi:hypothetical protein
MPQLFLWLPCREEQGLIGATRYAEQAKQKGLNIAGMITNDIIGNTIGGNGVRDNKRVRVFSEGVRRSRLPIRRENASR